RVPLWRGGRHREGAGLASGPGSGGAAGRAGVPAAATAGGTGGGPFTDGGSFGGCGTSRIGSSALIAGIEPAGDGNTPASAPPFFIGSGKTDARLGTPITVAAPGFASGNSDARLGTPVTPFPPAFPRPPPLPPHPPLPPSA